jgi:hypothetical protein
MKLQELSLADLVALEQKVIKLFEKTGLAKYDILTYEVQIEINTRIDEISF